MCGQDSISKVNINLLTAFFNLQKYLFPSLKSASFWCFVSLLIIASTEQFLAYKVGLISGAFYETLGNKDEKEFWHHVIYRQFFQKQCFFTVDKSITCGWETVLTLAKWNNVGSAHFEPLYSYEDKMSIKKVFNCWSSEKLACMHSQFGQSRLDWAYSLAGISEDQRWKKIDVHFVFLLV